MTTTDVALNTLLALRDLLSDPSRWTDKVAARDSRNYSCEPRSPDAKCWCLLGGLMKVNPPVLGLDSPAYKYIALRSGQLGYMTVALLNDKGGHEVVLGLLDDCVAERRRELGLTEEINP